MFLSMTDKDRPWQLLLRRGRVLALVQPSRIVGFLGGWRVSFNWRHDLVLCLTFWNFRLSGCILFWIASGFIKDDPWRTANVSDNLCSTTVGIEDFDKT